MNLQNVLSLSLSDQGRPLGEVSQELVADGLIDAAKAVVNTLSPFQRELKMRSGRRFLCRILPYSTDNDSLCGIVIIYIDITNGEHNAQMPIKACRQVTGPLERCMQERTAQLRALTMELTLAEEQARHALAHDLHDDLGQILTVTRHKLAAWEKENQSPSFRQPVREISSLFAKAHQSLHSMVFQLCPPLLHETGLVSALEWLTEAPHRVCGLNVSIEDGGLPIPLDLPVATLVFRAVREILINVAKHAGVDRAVLSVKRMGGRLKIVIADAGQGFDYDAVLAQPGALGLRSIQERLSYIEGGIEIESRPGKSTQVSLLAPLAYASIAPELLE
ncbi:hypothetical protein TPL01_28220 [Sulfuriferula plumbiphila]|uniref:Uncharacterized protein n=1 Tax=Sulfuriferula plumbiphila TaxID=171865 RepID=A0A512LB15_9PROT|nr:hypothetical protein SFPGR_13150 [Sulfuriferula plumbiphila]GEP31684.1 hypothetical protein TPL01_28220 [Sulfuriferula plumbiphila]